MSSNEITPEDSRQIIANIKRCRDNCEGFVSAFVAEAIQADYDDDDECWSKLLALVESASAKRDTKAAELADKIRKFRSGSIYYTIENALGLSQDNSAVDDCIALENAIRDLDVSEGGIRWPLDKNGIEIRPNDIVYLEENEYIVDYIALLDIGTFVRLVGSGVWYVPELLSHKKKRTLDDIKKAAHDSHSKLSFGAYEGAINELIDEAYEMGKANENE